MNNISNKTNFVEKLEYKKLLRIFLYIISLCILIPLGISLLFFGLAPLLREGIAVFAMLGAPIALFCLVIGFLIIFYNRLVEHKISKWRFILANILVIGPAIMCTIIIIIWAFLEGLSDLPGSFWGASNFEIFALMITTIGPLFVPALVVGLYPFKGLKSILILIAILIIFILVDLIIFLNTNYKISKRQEAYQELEKEIDMAQDACSKLETSEARDSCFWEIAKSEKYAPITRTLLSCYKIEDQAMREYCPIAVALALKDVNICKRIEDEKIKNDCYTVVKKNDLELLNSWLKERVKPIEKEVKEWKTYFNPDANFEFRYPENWEIKEDYEYKTPACEEDPECKGRQYIVLGKIGEPALPMKIGINIPQCMGIKWSDLPGGNWICVFEDDPEVLSIYEQIKKSFQIISQIETKEMNENLKMKLSNYLFQISEMWSQLMNDYLREIALSQAYTFIHQGNRYIVVAAYSGGAHCCYEWHILKVINDHFKRIQPLNSQGEPVDISIGGNIRPHKERDLMIKNNKLYLVLDDDRFAWGCDSYASTPFLKKHFLIDNDKIVLKNGDFTEGYLNAAYQAEKTLKVHILQPAELEIWQRERLCNYLIKITSNYLLAQENNKAWQKFNEYASIIQEKRFGLITEEEIQRIRTLIESRMKAGTY